MTEQPNRFVVEVRGGVALFFNRMIDGADGWWWGSDADPFEHGPFASSQEALIDVGRDMGGFTLVRWGAEEIYGPDCPLPPRGHLVLIDTGGKLWVKHGESPPTGWKLRQ